MKNRGNHVFLDFVNFYDDQLEECCKYVWKNDYVK